MNENSNVGSDVYSSLVTKYSMTYSYQDSLFNNTVTPSILTVVTSKFNYMKKIKII